MKALFLLAASAVTALLTGTGGWRPPTFPKDQIAFVSDRDGNAEIYVMNADGSDQTRLTKNKASDDKPAWSPDHKRIAFMSNRDGNANGGSQIYVMNSDGTGQTRLTHDAADDTSPTWSPDGKLIAFSSNRRRTYEIYSMNSDGTEVKRLTDNSALEDPPTVPVNMRKLATNDTSPAWSPDGKLIAFLRHATSDLNIYTMNPDGTGQTHIYRGGNGRHGEPAWSPDGRRYAFVNEGMCISTDNHGFQGGTLTGQAVKGSRPAWSPDGAQIAFVTDRDGNSEIYTMNSGSGAGERNITNNKASDTSPAW